MNQSHKDDQSAQFPLQVSPRFVPYFDRLAKRHDLPELPIRLTLDIWHGLDLETPAVFDPANDFQLKGNRVRIFIDRQQAYRVRGWMLQTVGSIDVPETPKLSPPRNMSTASNPTRLEIDRRLVRIVQPELNGWAGWLWRVRDRLTGENRFEGSFNWIADQINNGDARTPSADG